MTGHRSERNSKYPCYLVAPVVRWSETSMGVQALRARFNEFRVDQ